MSCTPVVNAAALKSDILSCFPLLSHRLDEAGHIRLTDFGLAKGGITGSGAQGGTKTFCGTPEYLAPEIVMSKGYDKGVDYWALGCLIYELYLARTPFQADYTTKIFQNIIAADRVLAFPPKMDPLHVALIKKLLSVNPAFRLGNLSGGIEDIISDPFFADLDWNAVVNRTLLAPYVPPINDALDSSNFDDYEEEEAVPEYVGTQEHFENF